MPKVFASHKLRQM